MLKLQKFSTNSLSLKLSSNAFKFSTGLKTGFKPTQQRPQSTYVETEFMLPSPRDDAKYAWLKSPTTIENNINKIVELPVFPQECRPKGITLTVAKNFFLTAQRASVLQRAIAEANDKNHDATYYFGYEKGMVIKGPFGIGKSCLTYLIASYAWVNKYPLVYIVS